MGFDKCMVSCIHYNIIQTSFTTLKKKKKSPVFHPFLIFSPNSWQSLFFCTAIIVLPSPDYHVIKIIQGVAFSDYFLSFSNMCLRFTHILLLLVHSFLILEYYSIVWMYHNLFIHLHMKGSLVVSSFWWLWIKQI